MEKTIKKKEKTAKNEEAPVKKKEKTLKNNESTVKKKESTVKKKDKTLKKKESIVKKKEVSKNEETMEVDKETTRRMNQLIQKLLEVKILEMINTQKFAEEVGFDKKTARDTVKVLRYHLKNNLVKGFPKITPYQKCKILVLTNNKPCQEFREQFKEECVTDSNGLIVELKFLGEPYFKMMHKGVNSKEEQVKKFLADTFKWKPPGILIKFQSIQKSSGAPTFQAFEKAQELGKNRYKDVECTDESRVILEVPPHIQQYIHANFVATPGHPKRFIATQGPLEKSSIDFWYMTLQEGVEWIVMLCNTVENGSRKCHPYFPTENTIKMVFKEKSQQLTVKYQSHRTLNFTEQSSADITETVLIVEGIGFPRRKMKHYQWKNWPDHGVPAADGAIMNLLQMTRASKGPILIHCSAGIGRTGTLIALGYYLDELEAGMQLESGDQVVFKIRQQRHKAVQTDLQFLFLHQTMLDYLKKEGLIEEENFPEYTEFKKKYKKSVEI